MYARAAVHGTTMRHGHGPHAQVMRDTPEPAAYHRRMFDAEGAPTRTLTIVLPESDWRALRAAEPDAVGWLQARIRERLESPGTPAMKQAPAGTSSETFWTEDEY